MKDFFLWFSGGSHQYMTGWECIKHDQFWAWSAIILWISIFIGYLIIARHWYINLVHLQKSSAKIALVRLVNIFLFCGLCGYGISALKMWWPAWKLHVILLAILCFFTWKYVLSTKKLKVAFFDIEEKQKLIDELQHEKDVNQEMIDVVENNLKVPVGKIKDKLESVMVDGKESVILSKDLEEVLANVKRAELIMDKIVQSQSE